MMEVLAVVVEEPILKSMQASVDIEADQDGSANTIVSAIKEVLGKINILTQKLLGLGTDGTAVMTGQRNGVAKQLSEAFPWMVSVACAAHWLALACKDASSAVPYMTTFKEHFAAAPRLFS
ncbi:hypothetical protein AAFF_G00033300 [Aldrovandia affinis]|uniref:DUF4371 domain-containing protein n=1 Tax=Aldrovandia affinis TaxID=143900 RepID=A0AAD7S3R2_9TELE|nr:hypothetical protein AAFF_G00033300 [Aldrovandia affinis]